MSYSPKTGLVYIPALDMGMSYTSQPLDVVSRYKFNIGYNFVTASMPQISASADSSRHMISMQPCESASG